MNTQQLNPHVLEERLAILREMESMFESKKVEYFVGLLLHPDRVIRIRALSVLEVLGSKDVVAPIGRVLLEDPDPIVRHEAAFVLGQLGYKAALPFLEKAALSDPSLIVRHEASVAIGVVGSPTSLPTLREIYAKDPEEEVRFSAEIAITNIEYIATSGVNTEFARKTGG
ncbi:MAG: HEAT repeat domain-containing protein [Thermoprotei archaeon]